MNRSEHFALVTVPAGRWWRTPPQQKCRTGRDNEPRPHVRALTGAAYGFLLLDAVIGLMGLPLGYVKLPGSDTVELAYRLIDIEPRSIEPLLQRLDQAVEKHNECCTES